MKKKYELEEKALYNVVAVYRERGNYLQRLEQFENAIQAYNEALRWNDCDVRSLLGRSLARAKTTHYDGALADAARATELEPDNLTALQIRAQTEYEKCAFERALVLARRGQRARITPPDFADCARVAEQTVRECVGKSAGNLLAAAVSSCDREDLKNEVKHTAATVAPTRRSRMSPPPNQYKMREMTLIEGQKKNHTSRIMASKYLERMAHDKYFLITLSKDERLASANKQGSQKLQELAHQALADVEKRQAVLRERRPLYAALASEAAARSRLSRARKEQVSRAQLQHTTDALRLISAAEAMLEKRETSKCLENAEFAMEQIIRKPANLLPGKDKFLQKIYGIIADAFLDQKRSTPNMSESDLEKRAFALLGIALSREPSRDSILRARPPEPRRDAKSRLRILERGLTTSARSAERCYMLHEIARLHIDSRHALKARFFAAKCQAEARAADQRIWLLNATFLLARCHVQTNNRPEARSALLEGVAIARSARLPDIASFFDTCVNVSMEGEVAATDATLEKREKQMVSLMQDRDLRTAAEQLFRRMSVIPAARRFSVLPGIRVDDAAPPTSRRMSIIPRNQQPTRIVRKKHLPLGFQDFDI